MQPTICCIDAGLVIWRVLFPDDLPVQQAWEEWDRSESRLAAPALLTYEVTNVLHRYQRQGGLSSETAELALQAALALPVEQVHDIGLHLRARQLAQEYGLPAAYDAHYLALAERLGAEFWTMDAKLVKALQPFELGWVRLVETTIKR